jgi:hypothetical protein
MSVKENLATSIDVIKISGGLKANMDPNECNNSCCIPARLATAMLCIIDELDRVEKSIGVKVEPTSPNNW